MESTCWSCSCGEGPVVSDPDSGALVCSSCGLIHDAGAAEFVDYRAAELVDYPAAEFVDYTSQQYPSRSRSPSAVITSTAASLGLPPAHVDEVLTMARSATDGNLATPGITSLPALAAACAFLVARSHHRGVPLFLPEAAAAASRTTFALADLVSSIASRLSLPPLPPFDHSAALERAVRRSRLLSGEKTEPILSQARLLLRCASKWSLATGRQHPLPLLASLIALAAELNGVTSVSVEAVAQEISAAPCTSRRRYNELVAALVRVARKLLPWGSDVNAGNLLLNAPVVLRLMESDQQPDRFLEGFAPDIAGVVPVYSSKCLKVVDGDFNGLKTSSGRCMPDTYQNVLKMIDDLKISDSERSMSDSTYQDVLKTIAQLKISETRSVPDTCENVLKRIAELKLRLVVGNVARRREQWKIVLELEPWMDSLDDDWTKDMLLDEVADIDIGEDAPPPSFTAGRMGLQKRRRRARIEAAKCRIDETRKAPAARSSATEIDSPSDHGNEDVCPQAENIRTKQGRKRRDGRDHAMHADEMDCGKKRRKSGACKDIDSEDCVIELLLLHGANEAEIEQGQYKRLLELHVFSAVSGDR